MNKKYLKLSIQIIFILLVLVLAAYLLNKRLGNRLFGSWIGNNAPTASTTKDIMTDKEKLSLGLYHLGNFEVISRNELGVPTSYILLGVEEPKPIATDIMSDADKINKRLATSTNIQVLKRDDSGRIVEYRIMRTATDTIEKY
ncbi:MAG: hypothetical protein WC719_02445 [Patescibacteria group bacterium]|jgi:hypothetical protein